VYPACAGAPLAAGMYTPLSEAVEAWHFDLAAPPEDSDRKYVLLGQAFAHQLAMNWPSH